MSDDRSPAPVDASEEAEEEFAPTPFDGPWFMPVVLVGATLWFAYDGFLNPDPDMQEWWWFNQGGCVVLGLLAAFSIRRALRERRERESSEG